MPELVLITLATSEISIQIFRYFWAITLQKSGGKNHLLFKALSFMVDLYKSGELISRHLR